MTNWIAGGYNEEVNNNIIVEMYLHMISTN